MGDEKKGKNPMNFLQSIISMLDKKQTKLRNWHDDDDDDKRREMRKNAEWNNR